MRRPLRVLVALGVVAAVTAIVVASLRGRGTDATEVYAEAASRREMVRAVKASGEIEPRVQVKISAHVVGRIERLWVEEGQRVEAGDPFLRLERAAFLAARDQAAAAVAGARTAVRQAEVDLADARLQEQRFERLAGEGIASQERLEARRLATTSAEIALSRAGESVRQAQAALTQAEDDLGKTTLFAPIAGRVVELNAEQGEVVVSGTMNNPASVIGTIADLSEILAVVDVDETEIVDVAVGQEATVEVDSVPATIYHGRVVEVGSSGFSRSRQPEVTYFRVKVLLADADERLRPGMSTRVSIATAAHPEALVVPIQAVVERRPENGVGDGDGDSVEGAVGAEEREPEKVVFVVAAADPDGAGAARAERRRVETGIADSTRVEVTAGLEAGERVVTGPYRTLRDLEDDTEIEVIDADDDDGEG